MKHLPSILSALIIFFGLGAAVAYAQNYTPLAPLPGTFETSATGVKTTNISLYLSGSIKLIIALGAALAVLFAIIGGTQYVAAGITPDAKSGAKERIFNSLIGLTIILTSYLLLNSINPTLVNVSFKLDPVTTGAAGLQTLGVVSTAPSFCSSITPFSLLLSTQEARQMEASNGTAVIFASTDPVVDANLKKLQTEVDKLQNALAKIGAKAEVTSAYRPYAYQKHLWQLFHAWKEQGLESNIDPACGPIKTAIGREYSKHALGGTVANPDNGNAPHTKGTGVDIKLTGIAKEEINAFMAQKGIKLRWQSGLVGDDVHYNLIQ